MPTNSEPELTMLWESVDPRTALANRFGFADVEEVASWLAGVLKAGWGIELISYERLVISAGNALNWVTTDRGDLIAKWSAIPNVHPRLAELARLVSWLDDRGLPVSAPIPALDGSPQIEVNGWSMGAQAVVDGSFLDVTDADRVREAGAVLARLHLALAEYPDRDRVAAVSARHEPDGLAVRLRQWLASRDEAPAAAASALEARLDTLASDALPTQLVHNDIRSANVLCAGGTIRAVLDFEDVSLDHCVNDLAHAAVLLGTRFHNWGPVSPDTQDVLVDGYRSARELSPIEERWLRPLILSHTVGMVPAGDDPTGWADSVARQLARI